MFSICTVFVLDGKLEETISSMVAAEASFTPEIGVVSRHFFQCTHHPHILWSITQWTSERHHNDAAQSIMKIRRDDRIASSSFGPSPYFEIFCERDAASFGSLDPSLQFFVIAHATVSERARKTYFDLRSSRALEFATSIPWFSIYSNNYNSLEFVAVLGFTNREQFENVRPVGSMLLEEYVLTGLRSAMGMSLLAGYTQYLCHRLAL